MSQKIKNIPFNQKLIKALKADPKKTATLTLLAAVLVIMWARMGMKKSETPASAATQSYVASGNRSRVAGDESSAAPDRWRQIEIPPLSRNLFTIKLDNFPLDGAAPAAAAPQAADGFWDRIAKSMAARADQKKERAALLENLTHQASQLRLQSILMGAKPRAVVNGELVGEGDNVVASGTDQARISFRVLKIEARRIIVEREGVRLEIQMN